MLLPKGVRNANLEALRDPQFCHFKVAPLRRTWVAPLGRSLTPSKGLKVKYMELKDTSSNISPHNDHESRCIFFLL